MSSLQLKVESFYFPHRNILQVYLNLDCIRILDNLEVRPPLRLTSRVTPFNHIFKVEFYFNFAKQILLQSKGLQSNLSKRLQSNFSKRGYVLFHEYIYQNQLKSIGTII
jgi:hypothetical protein